MIDNLLQVMDGMEIQWLDSAASYRQKTTSPKYNMNTQGPPISTKQGRKVLPLT